MHVPEGCDLTAADGIDDSLEPLCIAIYAVCLEEQCHIVLFRDRNELLHDVYYYIVVNFACRSGIPVTEDTDVAGADLACELGICRNFLYGFGFISRVINDHAGGQA